MARYAQKIDFDDLPVEVIHEAKRHIIDSFGCAMGAYLGEPGRIARELALSFKTNEGTIVLGTTHKSTPDLAAFACGTLIRYLDYNDTYLSKEPAHPSDNIAAVLGALTDRTDGRLFITAVVLGYEVQCRLCDAASLRNRGWDHVTYIALSSALAAAKVMKLPLDKTLETLALAGVPNIALRQTRVGELSMWKACAAANAARNGLFAALLARNGMTGPKEIFEGKMGFINQVSGPFMLQPFGGKGGRFKVLDSYIKYYPSEYHSQAGIEAALKLRSQIGNPAEIDEIEVSTYDAAVDIIAGDKEKWNPKTRETADHSLPYCIATALSVGKIELEEFEEEKIKDPKIFNLMQKIKVIRDSTFTAEYPEGFPCLLNVTTRTGKEYSMKVTYPKGHPKNPMTDKEIEDKFRKLAGNVLPQNKIDAILDRMWNLEKVKDMKELILLFEVEEKGTVPERD